MKPKHILPALLTAMTLSQTGCNPIQEDTRAQVDLIMKWSESTPENDRLLRESNDFYSEQPDFETLTPRQQAGKVILRKILSQAAETLKKGEGLQEFCRQVLQSADSPIDNPEVCLKVESDIGVGMEKIVFGKDFWEIFNKGTSNHIVEKPKVTSAEFAGDALTLTVRGDRFALKTLNPHGAFSETEGKKIPLGPVDYTLTISPNTVNTKSIAAK